MHAAAVFYLLPMTPAYSRLVWVGRSVASVCLSVCLSALEQENGLRSQNLVHVYSIVDARHALTHGSKGQRWRSHGYENWTVAQLLVIMAGIPYTYTLCATCGRCRRASACRYDCLCFL